MQEYSTSNQECTGHSEPTSRTDNPHPVIAHPRETEEGTRDGAGLPRARSREKRVVQGEINLFVHAARTLVVLLKVPASVVGNAVLGLEAKEARGLVGRHEKRRVAEREESLPNARAARSTLGPPRAEAAAEWRAARAFGMSCALGS